MKRPALRFTLSIILPFATCIIFALASLFFGAVDIPAADVFKILAGTESARPSWQFIVMESRLPMALTAMAAGSSLAVAGLMLQTTFENPLSGPSILGVSTGSSLGVAILTLGAGSFLVKTLGQTAGSYTTLFAGAALGAMFIIILLAIFSTLVRNGVMLLIVGIMISYMTSSAITLLNFFAPSDSVKTFAVWGMGSYSATGQSQAFTFCLLTIIVSGAAFTLSKKMNVLLLGARYAENLGYSVSRVRTELLIVSGLLTALATAYCGPISFIGLIVPHIARMLTGTSDHFRLIPVCFITGAAVSVLCALLSIWPSSGILPINAITPIVSVPVIIYIILNRRNLKYFS